MKRRDQILIALLVVQMALSAVVLWPRPAASGGAGAPLLGDLTAEQVVALIIEDGDGNRIEMRDQGGSWVLPAVDDFPVQGSKVTDLLGKLVGMTSGRLVTRTQSSHKRLQVDPADYLRRIRLETADGRQMILFLGSSPSYGATHVRLDGQDETYLTSDLSVWEANATVGSWIDTSYLSVPQENLLALTLQNANGTFAFEKDSEGNWTLAGMQEGDEPNAAAITTVVSRASTLNMLRPLGVEDKEAYGLARPQATITLQTAGGAVTWQVGSKSTEDNSYVVKSSQSPYYVRVSEFTIMDLLNKTQADFIQQSPTPTPEAGG